MIMNKDFNQKVLAISITFLANAILNGEGLGASLEEDILCQTEMSPCQISLTPAPLTDTDAEKTEAQKTGLSLKKLAENPLVLAEKDEIDLSMEGAVDSLVKVIGKSLSKWGTREECIRVVQSGVKREIVAGKEITQDLLEKELWNVAKEASLHGFVIKKIMRDRDLNLALAKAARATTGKSLKFSKKKIVTAAVVGGVGISAGGVGVYKFIKNKNNNNHSAENNTMKDINLKSLEELKEMHTELKEKVEICNLIVKDLEK